MIRCARLKVSAARGAVEFTSGNTVTITPCFLLMTNPESTLTPGRPTTSPTSVNSTESRRISNWSSGWMTITSGCGIRRGLSGSMRNSHLLRAPQLPKKVDSVKINVTTSSGCVEDMADLHIQKLISVNSGCVSETLA